MSRLRFSRAVVKLLAHHPLPAVARAAAGYVVAERWTSSLDIILQQLGREILREYRHLNLSIESARELTPHIKRAILRQLEQKLDAEDSSVAYAVNPELLGGFRAVTPVGEFDASVAAKLNQLKSLQ